MKMTLLSLAFSLFLLMDPIGNIPFFISFLKGVDPNRQRNIIIREMVIALVIIILFNFIGDGLMRFLHVTMATIQMAGGIILFLLCIHMVFPQRQDSEETFPHNVEPFIVPLAIPLIAGPSVLAAVMIYAQQESKLIMVGAICIAWAVSLAILISASFIKKILGWRGILAMERLMGLILTLIAVEMFLNGLHSFINNQ